MQKVVISIIGFAIAIDLIVGVIVPVATCGKTTGQTANTSYKGIDTSITSLTSPLS